MKRKCKEMKRIARENLLGNYTTLIAAYFMINMIVSMISYPFSILLGFNPSTITMVIIYLATFLISIATILLLSGQYRIHLAIARGQYTGLGDMFYPLTHRPDRYLLAQLIYVGLSIVCVLPLFISYAFLAVSPIVFLIALLLCMMITYVLIFWLMLTFQFVFYFLLDDESLGVINAFKLCREKMMGNKGRLLYMMFSFLPMYLLMLVTLGLAGLWVQPYQLQATTVLYLEISGQLDEAEARKTNSEPKFFNQYV